MADQPPRILLVEDDVDTAALMQETLDDHFATPCVTHLDCVEMAQNVDLAAFDIVLSDMNLPDGTGLDLLRTYLQRRPDIPIVLVTAEGILENAIEAIRQGAYDYVVKAGDYLFALPVLVEKNLAQWRLKAENEGLRRRLEDTLSEVQVKNRQLQDMVDRLETMAATDPLTGLANRRSIAESLERRFADATRHQRDLACIMVDLDGFKQLNDALGHQDGDHMLQLAARALVANCRRSDVAGRFGGDEFVLLLPGTSEEDARQVADRICSDFIDAATPLLARRNYSGLISMSMGLSTLRSGQPDSSEQLVAQADHALYAAKAAGKNRLVVHGATDPAPM